MRHPTDNSDFKFCVNNENRKKIKNRDISWVPEHKTLCCYFGVWDEGIGRIRDSYYEILVQTNRNNQCFFRKYQEGMLIPAAERLQKQETENRQAKIDRRLTIIGLWVAAFGILASALFAYLNYINE